MNFFRNSDWDWETSVDQADERQMEDAKTDKSKKLIPYVKNIVFYIFIGLCGSFIGLFVCVLSSMIGITWLLDLAKFISIPFVLVGIFNMIFGYFDGDTDQYIKGGKTCVLVFGLDLFILGYEYFYIL